MKDLRWLFHRLKSMNAPEMVWRLQQKLLQKKEYKAFYVLHLPVTEIPLAKYIANLKPDASRIPFNKENREYSWFKELELLGGYDYREYKTKWNAGFQTSNGWPERDFSYLISIGQREDIGDIRTNWELNRHYQFACMAKNYYLSGNLSELQELTVLFADWNRHNLFLHGAEWTSVMEVGIRCLSWIYTYVFLSYAAEKYQQNLKQILRQIAHGLLAMADHIVKHRARFSSANNHLIIEMFAVGMVGILFGYEAWIKLAVNVLTQELPRQNYEDGVNKEMSLHYQSFVMEAYGIIWLALDRNGIQIPRSWKKYLSAMSKYLADCCGDYGEVVVFGDNDEGKLLDLQGKTDNHYRYVLQLMGTLLDNRFTDTPLDENLRWLLSEKQKSIVASKPLYRPADVCCYKKGGYTILRSKDHKILLGMDHAELGFGRIAAHGHADALSIQLFYEGQPVLVDAGTCNYHVPKKYRNIYRATKAHNTVYVEGIEQAEMLGPFLWGKRYKVEDVTVKKSESSVEIKAAISYFGIRHTRKLTFDFERRITVEDYIEGVHQASQMWHWNCNAIELISNKSLIAGSESNNVYAPRYGSCSLIKTSKLRVDGYLKSEIDITEKS